MLSEIVIICVDSLVRYSGWTQELASPWGHVSLHYNESRTTKITRIMILYFSDVPSPVFHLTRSRLQTKSQEKAAQVISELREPVVIDRERLVRLLDLTVLLTEDYTVPRLEKLYSLYAQCIYQRRHDYNKTLLLEVSRLSLSLFILEIIEYRMRD